jgi:hypothetical protein
VTAASLKVVRAAAIRLARAPVLNTAMITLLADEVPQTGTVDHTPLLSA